MSALRVAASALLALGIACSPARRETATEAHAGIDSLNARLVQAYRTRDPQAYGALYTDSAIFEWPAFHTVRGRAGMEAMARSNWATQRGEELTSPDGAEKTRRNEPRSSASPRS